MLRSVKRIIPAQNIQMGEVNLKQPLPVGSIDQVDPFLLIHHIGPEFQEAGLKNIMDIGAHPHRGFEPISFVFKGEIHHRDSRGNDSKIKEGGVQWMTAGMGIVHSESASREFVEKGGEYEMIQVWVNLPAKLKMVQPKYQGFQREEIPSITSENGRSVINLISGIHNDKTGPVDSITGIKAMTITMEKEEVLDFDVSTNRNCIIYQLEGLAKCNDIQSGPNKLIVLNDDGNDVRLEAISKSRLLYLEGSPIGEKVTQYGPYVMNTQTEIMEAMRDFQMGKMGILI